MFFHYMLFIQITIEMLLLLIQEQKAPTNAYLPLIMANMGFWRKLN